MKAKILALLGCAGLALLLVVFRPAKDGSKSEPRESHGSVSAESVEPAAPMKAPSSLMAPASRSRPAEPTAAQIPAQKVRAADKLERLTQIREEFHALAAGAAKAALQAAKQLTNDTERETALLTLATEWTHGNLRRPEERARAIADYGLEAGLGMELAKNPELGKLWADELTKGAGRAALLGQIAVGLVSSDAPAAFGLGESLAPNELRDFYNSLFSGWAAEDTASALQTAEQVEDPGTREGALKAIRSVAPVGIGVELAMQEGYPVVGNLVPNGPAELSGLFHKGDRILAVAQGDSSYVDAHNLSLQEIVQMVRGAPGTTLQLQVLPADAPPDSAPRLVSVVRDQLKFKR
ncbi:MAG: hypothetical protein C5B50_17290 [Verrucomicrobia bacterium]|nr:MAG: hypothetical protein C5B50_17290 [Verrucomicrobiota bacterium]